MNLISCNGANFAARVLLAVVLLAACGRAAATTAPPPTGRAEASTAAITAHASATPKLAGPTARPTKAEPTPVPTPGRGMYANPVYNHDFPDPDVLVVGDTYYAYSTNSGETNVQVIRSTDLVDWEPLPDALPTLPAWAVPDFGWAWAPEVTTDAAGSQYIMYFTARFAIGQGGTQCIGVATSRVPEGPFTPVGEAPLICPVGRGGAIDAASFTDDDGTRYLLWKNDGNSAGGATYINIQRLAADGLSLETDPQRLFEAGQPWEGRLVEGPTMWKHDGRYYIFYSANDYASPRYAVGVAVADAPLGPYTKAKEPVLATILLAGIVGPGGQDVVLGPDGNTWILFHAWTPQGYRSLNLGQLLWANGMPQVAPLQRGPMPAPTDI